MNRRTFLATSALGTAAVTCFGEDFQPRLTIVLNPDDPASSRGLLAGSDKPFPVGFGKSGVLPAGSSFRGGYSLLGTFRINAILSADRFEMTESLIEQSGKSRDWLTENLFSNMSSIDFDGDGEGGEYGDAFFSLEPVDSKAVQPFHFGEYKNTFRWYSYAIHGTQDEERIGKCITGGCVNVSKASVVKLLGVLKSGDTVLIQHP